MLSPSARLPIWFAAAGFFRIDALVSVIDSLIGELSKVCAGLPDRRKGPPGPDAYTMSDIGLATFSVFFMGSPSFLASQTALAAGQGRSNCQTLFGMAKIPTDNDIRQMLDGASPAAFDGLFHQAIAVAGPLEPFQCLGGRRLCALDGTEHFCSRNIHCERCLTRKPLRANDDETSTPREFRPEGAEGFPYSCR